MKQAILIVIFVCAAATFVGAQSKSDKMYDTFSERDGISSFSFSKSMIDAIDLDLGDDGDERNVTGNLNRIRLMSYNPEKGEMSGHGFIKKAISLLPAQYNKFEPDDDGDMDVEIWLLGKRKKFQECHVFVESDSPGGMRFVVSFYGDFTVTDLENLKEAGKGFSGND